MSGKCWAVVPAAGVGRRMGGDRPKQYLRIHGRTVLDHTLTRLVDHPMVDHTLVVLGRDDAYWPESEFSGHPGITTLAGGAERADSVSNALEYLDARAAATDWVLVHDAARPCVPKKDITRLIRYCRQQGSGGILAAPVADTLKREGDPGLVAATQDRSRLWRALTPQLFRLGELFQALRSSQANGRTITDESSAMEGVGYRPLLIRGSGANIKITHAEDLLIAECLLRHWQS